MKKTFTFLFVLCCLSITIPVSALVPANTNVFNSNINTENVNNIAEDQAEMLKALGLFLGTDNGFELRRDLTRAEAGVLLVRTLGSESEALSKKNAHPFTDVPVWADKYIGWLYQNKITNGISAKQYGSGQPVTYWQFATFLSRACSGNDNFLDNGIGKEEEQSRCDQSTFYRADAVGLLTRFLGCQYSINTDEYEYITVAQHLVHEGVFSAEQLFEAGVKIYPINYHYFDEDDGITSTVLGVRMTKSALKGIYGTTTYPTTELPYFYAWTFSDDGTVLYKLDCLTLAETEVCHFAAVGSDTLRNIEHYATVGGKDYLGLTINGKASLVRIDSFTAETLAEGKEFGFSYLKYVQPNIWNDNIFVIMLDDTAYIATEDGISEHKLDSGVELVAVQDTIAVLYHEENGEAVIEGVSLADWKVTDTYCSALPETDYLQVIAQHADGIYGEAGLFIVRDGRLIRATERPVLDAGGVRYGASGMPVILTYGSDSMVGDTIIVLNDPFFTGEDDWREDVRLSNDPPHGIAITDILGADSAVFFYSRVGVGMGSEDVFKYVARYNSEEDHVAIWVESFSPGRPEMMEHDNQWYVDREQERLNALGYKPW